MIPIHKKGSRSDPNNYRPISLTSILSKIFEQVVLKYVIPYLWDNQLICQNQAGFVPKHSTTHQLIELCDLVVNKWKDGLASTIVFADISSTFDRLFHKLG